MNDDVHNASPKPTPALDLKQYSKKTPWIAGTFAVLVAVLLVIGFLIANHHNSSEQDTLADDTADAAKQPTPVDLATVTAAPGVQPLTLPGDTAAWYESTVYGRVSGYIGEWKADIGDKVKKGQLLCTIETPELDADMSAAQAKLNATQAEVTVEQSNSDFAKTTYDRWWKSPAGYVSEQEKQQKKADYDSSVAKLAAADAQVKLDQANLDRLNAMENFKNVTAPFDGIVTSRRIDIGDLVTAGSANSTTSLYVVAQAQKIRTYVDVPQQATNGIYVGMPASITTDQFPGRAFSGEVARTSNAINPQSRTLKVEIDIPNPDLTLMPGMYVEAEMQLKQASAVEVPASALLFRQAGPQVAVVGADNHVEFRDVTIAHDNGDSVQIASGVKADERVALNISSQINAGDVVTPTEAESSKSAPKVAAVGEHAVATSNHE